MIQRISVDQERWCLPPPGPLRDSALYKAYPALWHLVTCSLPPTPTPSPATAAGRPLGPKRTHGCNSLLDSELRGTEMEWAGVRIIFTAGTEHMATDHGARLLLFATVVLQADSFGWCVGRFCSCCIRRLPEDALYASFIDDNHSPEESSIRWKTSSASQAKLSKKQFIQDKKKYTVWHLD